MNKLSITFILCLIALTSCNRHTNKVQAGNAEKERSSETAFIDRALSKMPGSNGATLEGITHIATEDFNISLKTLISIKKDEYIQCSIKKFGMEVGRFSVTPNEIIILDRFRKKYKRMHPDELQQKGYPFSMEILENVLLGSSQLSNVDTFKTESDTTIVLCKNHSFSTSHFFDSQYLLVREWISHMNPELPLLHVEYEEFRPIDEQRFFAYHRNINWYEQDNGDGEIQFEFSNYYPEAKEKIDIKIPSHYEAWNF